MVAPNQSSAAAAAFAAADVDSAAAAAAAAPRPAVSARKRRANRRNAQQSTGPRTPEGKVRASRNATTHGIFCRDLVLEGEDEYLFHMTRRSFIAALKPQDAVQLALVDGAMTARWRMNRCQRAEADMIARRTVRARKLVQQRFDTLSRNMQCDDFSSAALAAQCERSETFRRHYEEWKELRACLAAASHPGHAVAALVHSASDQPLERLSRYEHRLEGSFHRCLRDLHVLKQRAKEYADEPQSPFLGELPPIGPAMDAGDAAGTTSPSTAQVRPPSPRRGEGGGEGRARGVGDGYSAESTNEELRNEPARLQTVPPHSHPLSSGERGPDPMQNEPTADAPLASAGPGGGSDDAEDSDLDPDEMARLRKIDQMLARCRPGVDDDEEEDAYDS
jgi:hypothetical protein